MFRKNTDHKQLELFNVTSEMNDTVRRVFEQSWAPVFYEHLFCQIDEEPFAVLYSDIGRPNFPVNVLVALEILACLHGYTVQETLEQYYFNLQFRWAVGVRNISDLPLAERTIFEFRERIYRDTLTNPGRGSLIHQTFDNLTIYLAKFMGIMCDEMRMDSTMVMSNIRQAGRLSLSYDILKDAVKACPEVLLSEELKEVLSPSFKKDLLYKTKAREVSSRLDAMLELFANLITIVSEHEALQELNEIQLLIRFFEEQAEHDPETGDLKAKNHEKGTTSKHLRSAYDQDATCRVKSGEVYIGYSANIAETCSDENLVQLVTDYDFEPNITADTTMAKESIPHLAENYNVDTIYVDGGYSGVEVHDVAEENNIDLLYTDMTGIKPTGLSLNDFKLEGNTITHCPAGHPSLLSIYDEENKATIAHFSGVHCDVCPLAASCPTKKVKDGRSLRVSHKQKVAAKTRAQIEDEHKVKAVTSKRAGIEGTNSCIKRAHGADKLRVRGHHRCATIFGFIMIAQNVKQLFRWARGDKRRSLVNAERRQRKGLLLVPATG